MYLDTRHTSKVRLRPPCSPPLHNFLKRITNEMWHKFLSANVASKKRFFPDFFFVYRNGLVSFPDWKRSAQIASFSDPGTSPNEPGRFISV